MKLGWVTTSRSKETLLIKPRLGKYNFLLLPTPPRILLPPSVKHSEMRQHSYTLLIVKTRNYNELCQIFFTNKTTYWSRCCLHNCKNVGTFLNVSTRKHWRERGSDIVYISHYVSHYLVLRTNLVL